MITRPKISCPNCGFEGTAKRYTPGSLAVLLVLLLLLIVPGVIYLVWMMTSRYWGCPECGFKHVRKVKRGKSGAEGPMLKP